MHSQWSISFRIVIIHLVFIRTISVCVPLCSMDAPTQSIYPHSATLFAAISACVFATIGVFGKFPQAPTLSPLIPLPLLYPSHSICNYKYYRQSDYTARATEEPDDTRTCDDRVCHLAQHIGSALLLLQPAPDCRAFLSGGAYKFCVSLATLMTVSCCLLSTHTELDLWQHLVQDLSRHLLWQCSRLFAEHGGHYTQQVGQGYFSLIMNTK